MSRYIDADKIEYYRDCDECHEECQLGCTEPFVIAYREDIDDIPTEDVAPVIHASWFPMTTPDKNGKVEYCCSHCRKFISATWNKNQKYCGACGARMDGK